MDSLPGVEWLTLNTIYRLTSDITAFAASPGGEDNDRSGPICELPEGADLEVCGGGFSKRTVKVRYGDCYYHVFWRDLASAITTNQTPPPMEQVGLLRLAEMVKDQDQAKTAEMSGRVGTNHK